jgi:integrase
MPIVRMTDAAVKRLKAPPGNRVDYFDQGHAGLHLRVTASTDQRPDRRTWSYLYSVAGHARRVTFGPYPALSLAQARQAATEAALQLRNGVDPAAAKAAEKVEAARLPDTVATVIEHFIRLDLERRKRAPDYIANTSRLFANHVLPRWGNRDIKSISKRDVIELLDAIMDDGSVTKDTDGKRKRLKGGPVTANRVFAALRAMFRWAARRGVIDTPPTTLVEAPGEETRRDRVLDDREIASVWRAADTLGYPFGAFFQLALLTGQRREEVACMAWDSIDPTEATWTLSAGATKPGRAHVVPLSPLALDTLAALPRTSSRYVFSIGEAPISGFSKAKRRLDTAITDAGHTLEPWTIHDLRRSCATGLARFGASRFVIGRVLNHADRTVTGIYDRYAYLVEKRHALEAWAQHLDGLIRPQQPPNNVVPLQHTAA